MNYKEKYDKITFIGGIKLNALIISGIIIASLLVIFALILLLPISFIITSKADKKTVIKIKILFFPIFSNNKPKKSASSKKQNSSDNKKSDEESKEKNQRIKRIKHLFGIDRFDSFKKLCRNVKEGGIDGTFSKTINIIKFILSRLKSVIKHIKIKKMNISFVSGGEDSASAAFGYGMACSAVYPITGYIYAVSGNPKNININLKCDFDADKPAFLIDAAFKIRIIYLLKAALSSAVNIYRANKE